MFHGRKSLGTEHSTEIELVEISRPGKVDKYWNYHEGTNQP